ncbi:hypothetical protein BOTBODRAFT_143383 [Botryobasidium botryosum FD-172 SS1]|uniref:Uncharacterized protein n=1 Tax=Botryobasidium botryosum (strain FD-172 SS1) TaxID=930990 RepID=A0A067N2K0_BOTB1|nr:hypothetical protein BOTBODRAFT_143383 [Botryobasidium botryosum FD-172 SS1]
MKRVYAAISTEDIELLKGDSGSNVDNDIVYGGLNVTEDIGDDSKASQGEGEKDEQGEGSGWPSKKRNVSGVELSDPQERDQQELEEDLAAAKKIYPFFIDELAWYPGHRAIERLKHAYREAHPNIRECSEVSGGGAGHDSESQEEE